MPVHCTCISTWSSRWQVRVQVQGPRAKYKYKYSPFKYKYEYKYSGFVLEYNSSTSTSTKYYISAHYSNFDDSYSKIADLIVAPTFLKISTLKLTLTLTNIDSVCNLHNTHSDYILKMFHQIFRRDDQTAIWLTASRCVGELSSYLGLCPL